MKPRQQESIAKCVGFVAIKGMIPMKAAQIRQDLFLRVVWCGGGDGGAGGGGLLEVNKHKHKQIHSNDCIILNYGKNVSSSEVRKL